MITASIITTILLIIVISTYNSLVKARNKVRQTHSVIDVQLKNRHDLIPNLVATVKSFMKHESELFEKITLYRSKSMEAKGLSKEQITSETQLSGLMSQLNITMENYPEIKSNQNVLKFQASMNECEEQIAAARRVYNSSVNSLNNKVESFPTNVIAGIFNFKTAKFFEISENERENVDIDVMFNN